MGIWGAGNRSLVEAAIRRRSADVIATHGHEIATDACESGGYLRKHGARWEGEEYREKPEPSRVIQLELW